MKRISMLSLPAYMLLMTLFLYAGTASSADSKGSAVAGKVVGRDGRPLAGIKIMAMLPDGEYRDGHEWFEVKTKWDGTFVLEGLYPGTYYRIVCDGGQCSDQKERIRSLPSGETLKLKNNFVLAISSFSVSPEGVIQDQRTGLEWAPVPLMTVNYEGAVNYTKSLSLAGGGWRLPTVDELKGLFESGQKGCGLDGAFEIRYPRAWASDPGSPSDIWLATFSRYELQTELWDRQSRSCDYCRVMAVRRAVRGSQASR